MKLKGYKNINFYADKTNHRTIYAEFVIPSSNNKMPEREKLVPLNSIDFESYIRAIVHAQIDGDKSVGKMLQELKDYFINYGCSDFISPKVRIAGRLKNGLIEYDLCNYNQEYIKITPGSWTISSVLCWLIRKCLPCWGVCLPQ